MPDTVSLAPGQKRALVATMLFMAIRGWLVMGVPVEGYFGGKKGSALIY